MNDWTREPNLQIGDLVYHLLYGREWIGIILSLGEKKEATKLDKDKKQVLVRMVPGTEFSEFFGSRPTSLRESSNCGWITNHWLVKFVDFP